MRRFGWLVWLSVVVGCGEKKAQTGPPIPAAARTAAPARPVQGTCLPRDPALSGVAVALLDPGAAPLEPLRLSPVAGAGAGFQIRVAMETDISLETAGVPLPMPSTPIPVVVFEARTEVLSVEADGSCCTMTTVVSASLEDTLGAEPTIKELLQYSALAGLRGYTLFSPTGQVLSLHYDEVGDPFIKENLEQFSSIMKAFSVPLPTQPVGVGARWGVENTTELNGLALLQQTTFTLREYDSERFVLDSESEQRLASVLFPGMSPVSTVNIKRMDSSGEGSMTMARSHPAALIGILSIYLELEADLHEEGQEVVLDVEANIDMSILPVP